MKKEKQVIQAEFIASFTNYNAMSHSGNPEYAFTGRSNVGKSSLINMLTGRKDLAMTSAKPGKTKLMNLFLINNQWNLMDLPGFGYAKVSKTDRKEWTKKIMEYIRYRKNLVNIFVLVDINIPPQKTDIDFINYLGGFEIPFSVVFTKCDRSTKNILNKNASVFKKELLKNWDELPLFFFSSAVTKDGKEEILDYIFNINKETTIVL